MFPLADTNLFMLHVCLIWFAIFIVGPAVVVASLIWLVRLVLRNRRVRLGQQ